MPRDAPVYRVLCDGAPQDMSVVQAISAEVQRFMSQRRYVAGELRALRYTDDEA